MFDLFLQGGTWIMSILIVELICLLFAAWKAPAWVREIGLLVLVTDRSGSAPFPVSERIAPGYKTGAI